jgi:hypothetical protein
MRRFLATSLLFACLVSLGLTACGGKSQLRGSGVPPTDGGMRLDATDARIPGTLTVDCGRRERFTAPGRPLTVMGTTLSDSSIASEQWSIETTPPGSAPTLDSMGAVATLGPDLRGDYVLRFVGRDSAGLEGTCSVTVHVIVGPPVAICPEDPTFRTPAGVPVRIEGDAFDDVAIVSATWAITSSPPGSMPVITEVAGPIIDFVSATSGDYELTLTAVDGEMAINQCVVIVHVATPPVVTCPTEPVTGLTRRPVSVTASATDDSAIVSETWVMFEQPAGSASTISPTAGPTTTLTPDRRGEYRLRFTATDDDGEMASCDVLVIGLPSPPEAICPPPIDTAPLTTVEVVGMAIDDGTIVSTTWRLLSRPMGSRAAEPTPSNMLRTQLTPDLAGEYPLELSVVDDDGNLATCQTTVRAVATEGLRVEIFWNTDGTDMDTHVMSPIGTTWGTGDDCYFGNCQGGSVLEWGGPGEEDNPHLDIDDTNGFGPENVNVDRPVPGTYRVGVHAWAGAADVTVRIYCGGTTTEPRQTFGPVFITSDRSEFWRVADVVIDGTSCSISDLAIGGRPNINGDGISGPR